MNRSKNGFTLVEVLVVITVIGILMAVSTFAYITFQGDARDNQRSTKATLITEALEKYYNKNGEYPSPKALTNDIAANTGASIASKLSLNQEVLLMPKAPSGTTNSIATTLGTADVITYTARSDINNTSCQNVATSGCDEFTVTYKKERTNEVVTIKSRHSGRPTGLETTPIAPSATTLSATQSGTNLIATSTVASCQTGTVAKYSFQTRTASGAWSAWSAWQASRTYTKGSNTDGVVYSFQVKVRCDIGTVTGNESAISPPVSITYQAPLLAPAIPALTVALTGTNVVATSAVTTCQSGTTVQYRIDQRTNAGTWTTGTWGTARTSSVTGPAQGTRYGFRVSVQCVRGTETAPSAAGAEVTYTHPISTPVAPTVTNASTATTTTWTANTTGCPTGTTRYYQYQYIRDGGGTMTAWSSALTTNASTLSTIYEGYQYTRYYQVRCQTTYSTSAWSPSSTASAYLRPIATPGAPYDYVSSLSSDRLYVRTNFTLPTCGPGTVHEWQYMANWTGTTTFTGTWAPTGLIGYASVTTQTMQGQNGNVPFTAGTYTRIQARARCVNQATNRMSGWGPVSISPAYRVP